MIFRMAWRNLWRNKLRTLITMGAVVIAVLLATVMRSLQEGTYGQMIDNVVGSYLGYIQVHQQGYWDDPVLDNSFALNDELEAVLTANEGVSAISPRLESFALASAGNDSRGAMVVGIDPTRENNLTEITKRVQSGEFLESGEAAALVGEGLADKLGLGIGDTLVLLGQGYHGATAAGKYRIKGLLSFGSPLFSNQMVMLPLSQAQDMYAAPDQITSLVVAPERPSRATKIVQALQTQIDTQQLEVMDWQSLTPELIQMIEADRGGGVLMIGVLYMIVGFLIFGTVLMMTAERQYEFGVMVAIGLKNRQLTRMVIIETVMVSLLGVLAGSIISLPIVYWLHIHPLRFESMAEAYAEFGLQPILPAAIDPQVFISQAITVGIIAILVSLYPALRLLKLNPTKAMRA